MSSFLQVQDACNLLPFFTIQPASGYQIVIRLSFAYTCLGIIIPYFLLVYILPSVADAAESLYNTRLKITLSHNGFL